MSPVFASLEELVARFVADGQCLALEGFTHLIPFAAAHEIIRQRRAELRLVRMTPDLVYDQLIGAGCAAELTFSWGGLAWARCTACAMLLNRTGPVR